MQVGANAEPERFFLKAHGKELADRQRHAPVKGEPLRHIPDAGTVAVAADVDAALIPDFPQQGKKQGGFPCPVGADNRGAAALGHRGGHPVDDGKTAALDRDLFKTDGGFNGLVQRKGFSCCQAFFPGC